MRANGKWCAGALAATAIAMCVQLAAGQAAVVGEAAAAAPARAQVAPKDRNAAIKYLALFAQLTKSGAAAGLDWDAIGTNLDPAKMPAEYKAAVKVVDRAQIDLLREAAALEKCDFENHYEDGWAMLLPALGNFRQSVRLLRVDAREAIIAGDMDRAADNLVAGYRMVTHVTRDPIMICSLVGTAMSEYLRNEVTTFVNAPGVTREQKQRVADAVRALGDDPFNIRSAIQGERALSLNWMRRKVLESDEAGRASMLAAINIPGGVANEDPEYVLLMNLGRDELISFIDLADPMYSDLAAAWDAPDALDLLKEIEAKLQSGGYGMFAKVFGPAFNRAHASTSLGELHLRQVVADLESRPVKSVVPVGATTLPTNTQAK